MTEIKLRSPAASLPRNRQKVIGCILVSIILAAAIFAPAIAPHDPIAAAPAQKLLPPSLSYPFGTDQLGRCIFSRIIWGTRASIGHSRSVLAITVGVGTVIGLISGYIGGRTDRAIMAVTNVFMSFPSAVLALAIAGILGPSIRNLIIAMSAIWWTTYARVVRGMVMETKEQDFIMVAHATGCTHAQILFRHILKNIVQPIIVLATLDIGGAIIAIAGYSFIGLGAQPPTPEWGVMLNDAKRYIQTQPQLLLYPGLAVAYAVMSFNILGESLKS